MTSLLSIHSSLKMTSCEGPYFLSLFSFSPYEILMLHSFCFPEAISSRRGRRKSINPTPSGSSRRARLTSRFFSQRYRLLRRRYARVFGKGWFLGFGRRMGHWFFG